MSDNTNVVPPTSPLYAGFASDIPDATACEHARRLYAQVAAGDLAEALATLSTFSREQGAAPLLTKLAQVVANRLVAEELALWTAELDLIIDAMGIAPLLAQTLIQDDGGCLHLMVSRTRHDDAIADELVTVCGLRLWSDLEAPVQRAERGSWREPDHFDAVRCQLCAPAAAEFPEAAERMSDANSHSSAFERIQRRVGALAVGVVEDDVWRFAHLGQDVAEMVASGVVTDALIAELAACARDGGDATLERILMSAYTTARDELDDCGYTGPVSELISLPNWDTLVAELFDELCDPDGPNEVGLVYCALRETIRSAVRREQMTSAPERHVC